MWVVYIKLNWILYETILETIHNLIIALCSDRIIILQQPSVQDERDNTAPTSYVLPFTVRLKIYFSDADVKIK